MIVQVCIQCRAETLNLRLAPQLGQKPRRLQLKVRGRLGQLLMVTGVASNPQETMFQSTTFEVVLELCQLQLNLSPFHRFEMSGFQWF